MDAASDAPARIDVISDVICPWCFIGKRQMERALALLAPEGLRFSVHWRPFQLNPDMPPEGAERDAYRAAKFGSLERARELDAQVAEAGAAVGIGFRHDLMRRTPNTLDAHRLLWVAEGAGMQDAVAEALFRAYFLEGRDVGDRAVLAGIADGCGMRGEAVRRFLDGPEGREDVLAAERVARQAGISGVPTFALDGHILFSGAVPAETMAEALRAALRVLRPAPAGSAV